MNEYNHCNLQLQVTAPLSNITGLATAAQTNRDDPAPTLLRHWKGIWS